MLFVSLASKSKPSFVVWGRSLLGFAMVRQSHLVSPSLVADMKAELQSLADTEPGAKDLDDVVSELMPLIRGCRQRGHSWKRIAESLGKFHQDLTISRLKRIAFELDPSLKGSPKGSAIPEMDSDDSEKDSGSSVSTGQSESMAKTKKQKAIDFEAEL
ncbi:MAG: hypothetical protein AAGB01_10750 [Cyanobacteria bacterium P01_F01_bin.42]